MPALTAIVDDGTAYLDHERIVLAMLSVRYRDIDPDGRRELYQEAWASVLKQRRDGAEIENLRAYLLGAADKLASKRVYGADARRRRTFDPTGTYFRSLPDSGELPEERVLAADEARRVRMLVDELGDGERDLLKLRLDQGLEPAEIRERLGLTDRQYRRSAERATKALLQQFRAFDTGEWARGKRSLLCACVMGVASQRQREKAEALIQTDPCCRAMMGELRKLGEQAAAVLPLPAGALAAGRGPASLGERATELFEAFSSVRRHAAEAVAGAKEQAANVTVRAADPTPLAAARPGAAVAMIASCVAAGTGAYCAVEGVPEPLRPTLGIERPVARAAPAARAEASPGETVDTPSRPTAAPPPGPTAEPQTTQPESPSAAEPVQTSPAPSPAQPAPAPALPETEFEPTVKAATPGASTSAPRPAPQATPAPASSGSGEFAP